MSLVRYDSASRRLKTVDAVYCTGTGLGYCRNVIVLLVSGRLQSYTADTAHGYDCPSNPVKYSSSAGRLFKGSEAYRCYDIVPA